MKSRGRLYPQTAPIAITGSLVTAASLRSCQTAPPNRPHVEPRAVRMTAPLGQPDGLTLTGRLTRRSTPPVRPWHARSRQLDRVPFPERLSARNTERRGGVRSRRPLRVCPGALDATASPGDRPSAGWPPG